MRNDLQQGFALTHHSAFGVHTEVDRHAIGGGEDLAVLQIETGGGQLFGQCHAFQLRIGQLRTHFLLVFLAVLLQLQARFKDALLHAPAFTGVFRQLLLHLRQLPLVVHQAVARDVAVVGQRLQIAQLLLQGTGLGIEVAARAAHAGQLCSGAFDVGAQCRLLPGERFAAAAEQLPLAFQHQRQARVRVVAQFGRKGHLFEVVALGLPAREAGPSHAVLRLQRLYIGGDLRLIEAEQWLALLHDLAFAHQNPADHAAAHRLHSLAFARHHHGALHRNALIQRRQCRPGEETASADDGQNPAQACEEFRIAFRALGEVGVFHVRFVFSVHAGAAHTPEFLVVG